MILCCVARGRNTQALCAVDCTSHLWMEACALPNGPETQLLRLVPSCFLFDASLPHANLWFKKVLVPYSSEVQYTGAMWRENCQALSASRR